MQRIVHVRSVFVLGCFVLIGAAIAAVGCRSRAPAGGVVGHIKPELFGFELGQSLESVKSKWSNIVGKDAEHGGYTLADPAPDVQEALLEFADENGQKQLRFAMFQLTPSSREEYVAAFENRWGPARVVEDDYVKEMSWTDGKHCVRVQDMAGTTSVLLSRAIIP